MEKMSTITLTDEPRGKGTQFLWVNEMMRAAVLGALAAASGVVAQQGLTTTQPNFIFVLAGQVTSH
jgi:hypothetical protein